jgi:hypothetical protein
VTWVIHLRVRVLPLPVLSSVSAAVTGEYDAPRGVAEAVESPTLYVAGPDVEVVFIVTPQSLPHVAAPRLRPAGSARVVTKRAIPSDAQMADLAAGGNEVHVRFLAIPQLAGVLAVLARSVLGKEAIPAEDRPGYAEWWKQRLDELGPHDVTAEAWHAAGITALAAHFTELTSRGGRRVRVGHDLYAVVRLRLPRDSFEHQNTYQAGAGSAVGAADDVDHQTDHVASKVFGHTKSSPRGVFAELTPLRFFGWPVPAPANQGEPPHEISVSASLLARAQRTRASYTEQGAAAVSRITAHEDVHVGVAHAYFTVQVLGPNVETRRPIPRSHWQCHIRSACGPTM